MEAAADRRCARHLQRTGGVRDAVLVCDQAGDRQGRADLELRRGPRLWPGRILPGAGAPARRRDAADERHEGHAPSRGPSLTRRPISSPRNCAGSSAYAFP